MTSADRLHRLAILAAILTALTLSADDGIRVDPPSVKSEWTAAPKLKVSMAKTIFEPEVTYAEFGPFVAIGRNSDATDERVFADLSTGKTLGRATGSLDAQMPAALRDDGKVFAITKKTVGHGESGLIFVDTATGKTSGTLALKALPDGIWFLAKGKVLVRNSFWAASEMCVYDIAAGKQLQRVKLKDGWAGRIVAVAPGGTLFAYYDNKNEIEIVDVAAGKELEPIKIPAGRMFGIPKCQGLAFSPDGSELACYAVAHTTHSAIRWNLRDGTVAADFAIDKPTRANYPHSKLEWSSDGLALMVDGELVVDKTGGKTLYRLATELGAVHRRRIADATTVLDTVGKRGENRDLVAVSQDKDKIARLAKSFAEGKGALEALLPPTTAISLGKVEPTDVPLVAAAWQYKVAAAPAPVALPRRGIPLGFPAAEIDSIHVAGGKKPSVVMEISKRNAFNQPEESAIRTVVRVDLSTGRELCRMELPAGIKLGSISADGERASTLEVGPTARRVDVWELTGGGKHVVGLRPGEKETDAKRGRPIFAGFSRGGKLVTVGNDATVVSWSIPECTADWMLSMAQLEAPSIDPSGTVLSGFSRDGIRLFDLDTGTLVGDLIPSFDPPFEETSPRTVCFRADGKQAASIQQKAVGQNYLVSWDLTTGKIVSEFVLSPIYGNKPRLSYAQNGLLLIDEKDLIDATVKDAVWSYAPSNLESRIGRTSPDNRLWYAISPERGQPGVLHAVAVPDADTFEQIRTVSTGPGSLIKPGAKVSIELDYTGSFAASGKRKTLAALGQIYASRGLVVVEKDGDIAIRIRAVEKPTKDSIAYESLGNRGGPGGFGPPRGPRGPRGPFGNPFGDESGLPVADVAVIEIEYSSVASIGEEKIWEPKARKFNMRTDTPQVVTIPRGTTDLTKYLHESFWEMSMASAAADALPRFLAKGPNGMVFLPKSSLLTPMGVQPVPAK